MHRAYQSFTPANNVFLKHRWDQDSFNIHREKVKAAKPYLDNKAPNTFMHLHIKCKKLQTEAERLAVIHRDNRILLEKMAYIMRTGGTVDHRKTDHELKSLNKTKRQRELLRITHENLAILKRITTKEPHLNCKRWVLEWQVNQQHMMNVAKFPHPWRAEQRQYVDQLQRQSHANKTIIQRVREKRGALEQEHPNNSD